MNRSFASFLTFLLILALVAAGGVWWLGVDLVDLALDEERRTSPYQLLHFADAETGSNAYASELAELAREEEGQLVWRGGLTRLLDGRSEDEWQDLMIFSFSGGGGLVQLVTSPEYRELAENRRNLLLGLSSPPLPLASTPVLMIWLHALPADDSLPPDLTQVTMNLGQFGGALMLESALDQAAGESPWNRVAVISFPSTEQASSWFRDAGSETERTLAGKHLQRQAWLLLAANHLR